MARKKSENPVTTTYGFVVTDDEAARIDEVIREHRRRTGEACTRSSFLRALVLAALPSPTPNP